MEDLVRGVSKTALGIRPFNKLEEEKLRTQDPLGSEFRGTER
jgi:hypothetical protein